MAFCPNCGKEVNDAAVICVNCGVPIKKNAVIVQGDKWNTGTYVGLIIGTILIPLIGVIAGIYGLTKDEKRGQGGTLLAIAAGMTVVWIMAQ